MIVGILLLISWFVGLIIYIIWMKAAFSSLPSSGEQGSFIGLVVVGFVGLLIFGPALGILFMSHSISLATIDKLMNRTDTIKHYINKKEKAETKKRFSVGEQVVLLKDIDISSDGKRIVKAGTYGLIKENNENDSIVVLYLDGVITRVKVNNSLLK